jgi:hypothetical protein
MGRAEQTKTPAPITGSGVSSSVGLVLGTGQSKRHRWSDQKPHRRAARMPTRLGHVSSMSVIERAVSGRGGC